MSRTLSHDEARRVYDRIGARQDTQAFYEDRATDLLIAYGAFERAHCVFELGCGTGRFAGRLLAEHLPADAAYVGIDLSPEMVRLARERLRPFRDRAEVRTTDGSLPIDQPDASADRFVSNYVLDLLSEGEIRAVLEEAHRILRPRGLACLASLTTGAGPVSRFVAASWSRLHRIAPALVGGCRPIELLEQLEGAPGWRIRHHQRVAPFGLPSEVVIAERASAAA